MNNVVYALVDPRTEEIRYIGKTSNPRRRRGDHEKAWGNAYCANWKRTLFAIGLKPGFVILEECTTEEEAYQREIYWIAYGRQAGWPLTNLSDGGKGGCTGYTHTEDTRRKISVASKKREALKKLNGWTHSEEARRKIGEASRQMPRSKEWCQKISRAIKGRSNPHEGHPISEEGRAKIGAAQAKAWERDEYRQHMSDIHKKEYPALYNLDTGEVIPPGRGLREMCEGQGLWYHTVSRLIRGIRTKPYKGWVLYGNRA